MDNYFIIEATNYNGTKTYVSNTSPIIWNSDIRQAKKFLLYKYAKYELEDNFISLAATINNAKMQKLEIIEYSNSTEIRRERFL